MTIFHIKLIAIITMVVDHIGAGFFPYEITYRLIGRLSFVLFAWLVANGAMHTRDIKKYGLRLLLLGLVSQVPFTLFFGYKDIFETLNILFTLFLGLLAIYALKLNFSNVTKYLIVLLILVVSELLNVEYGSYGVLTILAFYFFMNSYGKLFILLTVINTIYYISAVVGVLNQNVFYFQYLSLLALILLPFYKGKLGPSSKTLFYTFYPVHLFILYLIGIL